MFQRLFNHIFNRPSTLSHVQDATRIKPLAEYINCPPNICNQCNESSRFYSQFADPKIICQDCLNGDN